MSVETSSPSFRTTLLFAISAASGIGDHAGDRAGRRDRRRAQVDLGLGVAHPPLEVAVRGRQPDLAAAQGSLVHAEARAAAGVADDRAGLDEVLERAAEQRLAVDAPG